LRHLQRSEVDEVEEDFSKGQKGSSAMPHKKNPISSENLTGGSRLLRGYAVTALENIALWHERDISHSSAERVILPDATTLSHYMLSRLRKIIEGLNVKAQSVKKNLEASQGVYFSGQVLLQLVERGLSREEGYRLVQACAHRALEERRPFQELLAQSSEIGKVLPSKDLNGIFDLKRLTRHADQIYERVLKDEAISRG
jgi:adenylosuccinate lyase